MPNISFVSGGDLVSSIPLVSTVSHYLDYHQETANFVAYVAKSGNSRACYVLQCQESNVAREVIRAIGEAFELRFKEFIKRKVEHTRPVPVIKACDGMAEADRDYYNDLPGKQPPDMPTADATDLMEFDDLIDLNTEVTTNSQVPDEPEYVNCESSESNHEQVTTNDPFDILPEHAIDSKASNAKTYDDEKSDDCQFDGLRKEIWFHNSISRDESENLLNEDGDFLVRESQRNPGQFVLTGMQNGLKKHLLLVDPEGIVRLLLI